jgi:hypothetical protein
MRSTIVALFFAISFIIGSIYPMSGFAQPSLNNQQAADKIADSLGKRFPNYDIVVKYRSGQLQLQGEVGSKEMAREIGEFVRKIDGVTINSVDNQLQVGKRSVGFIPANSSDTANILSRSIPIPTPNVTPSNTHKSNVTPNAPTPNRSEPVVSSELFSALNESVEPETVTPNPATTRRFGNSTSPINNAPIPVTNNTTENNNSLLVANANRNQVYPNTNTLIPPSLSNNVVPYNNTSVDPNPNMASYQNNAYPVDGTRPMFRPAVSPALPLYATSAQVPYGNAYVANNPNVPNQVNMNQGALPAPAYGNTPYYGATGPMPSAYNNPYLPPYAWPSYAAYPNYAQVSYPRSYSVQSWPYIGPFYPYPQAPLGWRQVTLKYHNARWWLDFNDGESSGPLSPLFRQPMGYRY